MHLVLQPGMPADTLDQKCRPAFPADISCKKVAAENESAPLWTKSDRCHRQLVLL